ncbi:19399_t:CDS:1, partial [Entrophospora sp. SA101]
GYFLAWCGLGVGSLHRGVFGYVGIGGLDISPREHNLSANSPLISDNELAWLK